MLTMQVVLMIDASKVFFMCILVVFWWLGNHVNKGWFLKVVQNVSTMQYLLPLLSLFGWNLCWWILILCVLLHYC